MARPPSQRGARAATCAFAAALCAVVGCALGGCADPALLDLSVVLPDGPDPLEGVDRLRLRIASPAAEQEIVLGGGGAGFEIERTVELSGEGFNVSSVVLEGLRGADIVARGETPPLLLRARDDAFNVLVTRAGAVSTLRPRWSAATVAPAAAVLPSAGLLLAGGLDATGKPTRGAWLYDFFAHALDALPDLPQARQGALAAGCGGRCALVLLGRGADGTLASQILRFNGMSWLPLDDNIAAEMRRERASMAQLADGRWLIVGGVDRSGAALDSLLRLDPGTPDVTPRLQALVAKARAARVSPATSASGDYVLVAGGQQPGEPLVEIYDAELGRSEVVDLGASTPADGCAAAALADGRFVVAGGRKADGSLSRDVWIIDPTDRSTKRAVDVLSAGRAGHRISRIGDDLVVLGGEVAAGPTRDVEIIASDGLASAGTARLARARGVDLTTLQLAPGVLFIAGGAESGSPIGEIEVFQSR